MINEKVNLYGIYYTPTNYVEATKEIIDFALQRKSYGVSALAVHGLIAAYQKNSLKELVNKIPLVVPDGQPIRWAINSFYNTNLKDRVYGPALTLSILHEANEKKLNVYLYGSTKNTLQKFRQFISNTYSDITICGIHEDRFRDATYEEDLADIVKINNSGAHIVLVGRGCPRQEIWVAEHLGKVKGAMLAVGAAFDFHAGTIPQAPKWMQDRGLEWFFRLIQEPQRLWKRYLFTNSYFVYLFVKHKFFLRRPY